MFDIQKVKPSDFLKEWLNWNYLKKESQEILNF
jgi:hypothetical protein